MALSFRHPRRRLAFVMVAHTGILLIGVGCLSARGLGAAAVYAVGDGTVKAALFLSVALLGVPAEGVDGEPGNGDHSPGPAWTLLAVGGLATAGLPLFGAGLGKAAIEDAASVAGYAWVAPVIVVVAALTGAAVLDLAWSARSAGEHMVTGSERSGPWSAVGWAAALLGASAAATVTGPWAARAASRFVDAVGYQQQVLAGGGLARPANAIASLALSPGGALLDLLAVAGAIAVSLGIRLSPVPRLGPVVGIPRLKAAAGRLHDGSIGDSVTWATVGTAVLGVVFALTLR